jgi:hypothetical protein
VIANMEVKITCVMVIVLEQEFENTAWLLTLNVAFQQIWDSFETVSESSSSLNDLESFCWSKTGDSGHLNRSHVISQGNRNCQGHHGELQWRFPNWKEARQLFATRARIQQRAELR